MIPEIGVFSLILALILSCIQSVMPVLSKIPICAPLQHTSRISASLQFLCISIAFIALILCHLHSDFTVVNVIQHSHRGQPLLYKLTGTWGNHEGSMLLWVWIVSLFGFLFATRPTSDTVFRNLTLSIQACVASGFFLFILLTSNPFTRVFPPASDGEDLNPLLQDVALAIHPPMLYVGYVGSSLVFALAVAALIQGRMDQKWADIARPWILITWAMLTLGIGLGSWWAYRELGWGGWWFWDPVENVSLLPWLTGTALLHSNAVLLKRGILKRWVLLLAILTFSLSLLGTFLVRSGIITSVHSFASDPARGLFILLYMGLVVSGSLLLYALRARLIESKEAPLLLSREGALLVNNLLLLTLCATIALGTLYPLFIEAIKGERVSVGPPYFNSTVLPLSIPLFLLAGAGFFFAWKKADAQHIFTKLRYSWITTLLLAILSIWHYPSHSFALMFVALGVWIILGSVSHVYSRLQTTPFLNIPRQTYGMVLSHMGVGLFIGAVAISNGWKKEIQHAFTDNQERSEQNFTLTYHNQGVREESNYTAHQAKITVTHPDYGVTALYPESRDYIIRKSHTSEVDYHSTMFYDLYAVITAPDDEGRIIVRFYFMPMMNMIWMGIIMIAAGALLSAKPREIYDRHSF